MIVDLRSYTMVPGRLKAFLALYEAEALPIQLRHLGKLIGYFTTEIGTQNQVVHLWGYESLDDRQTRRASLLSDPEWRAFFKQVAPMILSQESRILLPAKFSPIK